jgi:hypothetical protein
MLLVRSFQRKSDESEKERERYVPDILAEANVTI